LRRKLVGSLALALLLACRAREAPARRAVLPTAPPPPPTPVLGFIDETRTGTPHDGGTLRRRLIGEPATLNPVLQTGLPEQQVLQYLSRNLLDFDAGMKLVPGLAEGYEVSRDGREYTFRIRPAAVWEDGTPVSAADAVFTIHRVVDPKVPAPVFKSLFDGLVSVEARGARTFIARFREPYAYRSMAFVLPLVPEARFAGRSFVKSPLNRRPLSDGPYRLAAWKTQDSIELVRNERYWGPRPHFDRVVLRILPENAVAYHALLQDGLDETWADQAVKEKARREPEFAACCRLVEFYDLDYNYIALNDRSPLFSDARVRRALTMLLDRAAIVRGLFRGSARIISGPWAPDSPAYDPSVLPLPFDPAAAARLLEEAGWRDTNGNGIRDRAGREFEFELLVSSGSAIGQQIDEVFAGQLARAGISAKVRPLDWSSYVERVDAGNFEAASGAWSASDPNPDPYPYWHSSQVPPAGLNSGFYSSPEADRLMEQARREMDEGRRLAIYHRLHRIFRDDAPAIWVTNASQKYAFGRDVRGLATSPLGLYGIWPGPLAWWKEEGGRRPAPAGKP
jgi:peptide/nickel transport system substrate-binding protein